MLATRVVNARTRYVVAGGGVDLEQQVLLRAPVVAGLLAAIHARPGLTLSEAAATLGRSRFALRVHVDRLERMALVRVQQDGSARRLHPATPPGAEASL